MASCSGMKEVEPETTNMINNIKNVTVLINDSTEKEGIGVKDQEEAVCWVEEGEEDDDARVELGLVGKIWTKRRINATAFMDTMKSVWQPSHGVDISSLGDNTFVFQFHHWRDKNKVVEGQPWHFDNHAILKGDIEGNVKPSDMELFQLPMWVRIYNLPFKGRLNMKNVEAIGKKLGQFVKMDMSGSLGIDKSMRMRVNVDVRKPLVKAVKVQMRGGMEDLFEVKYERPPIFCYYCGRLGHGVKDCQECGDELEPKMNYGGWLKASPWRRSVREVDTHGGGDSKQCARRLFITKPKEIPRPPAQQVNEVLEKLNGCPIRDTNSEGQVEVTMEHTGAIWNQICHNNDSLGTNEESREDNWEVGGKEVMINMVERGPERGDSWEKYEGVDLVMEEFVGGRKWKRASRKGEGVNKKEKQISGQRRKERGEDLKAHEDVMDTRKKPKSVDTMVDNGSSTEIQDIKVASPTQWALGAQ